MLICSFNCVGSPSYPVVSDKLHSVYSFLFIFNSLYTVALTLYANNGCFPEGFSEGIVRIKVEKYYLYTMLNRMKMKNWSLVLLFDDYSKTDFYLYVMLFGVT